MLLGEVSYLYIEYFVKERKFNFFLALVTLQTT